MMEKYINNFFLNSFDNPISSLVMFMVFIIAVGLIYLVYINGDQYTSNKYTNSKKNNDIFKVLIVIIKSITIFIIITVVVACILLVYFEKKNANLLKDIQMAMMLPPDQQNAMIEKYKKELINSSIEFFKKKEVHLLFIYVMYKRVFLFIFKSILSTKLLTLEDRYFFIIDAFMMFFLTGYFELNYPDSPQIQILLIILNIINITMGCYRLVSSTEIQFNNLYLTENILFLYIIISIII